MVKSSVLTPTDVKKQTVMVDIFAGIDRSTWRARIEGKGERLYEAKNVFPYIQGKMQRRRDSIQTNSRDSNNAFPSFPVETMVGNPIVKKVIEFNNTICIFYIDDGDSSPQDLLMDSFDTGANTLTNRIAKTDAHVINGDYQIDAVLYKDKLRYDGEGSQFRSIDTSWVITAAMGGNGGEGACQVFLQALFHVNTTSPGTAIGRTAPSGGTADVVIYNLEEAPGDILKLLSFGYQTSSSGATTLMLIFKPSSIYVLTGIGATESMEQVTGNIGLVGQMAITYTPLGVCFVGRDTDGLLNIYLIDRNYFTLQTIGHELYEELNNVPAANLADIVVSFHRNRMVRIAITKSGDAVSNLQEYWLDLYNNLKKRTLWGPFPHPASNSLIQAVSFSGGNVPANAGYFKLLKEGSAIKIYEDVNTDTYDSTDSEWDDQVWRTKMYDFGRYYGIINRVVVVARANGAKFKVYYEEPKLTGDDDDTTQTLIGSYQMGTGGANVAIPIRLIPAILKNQVGFKLESDYDGTDNNPLEPSQIGFEYETTKREVIE